MPLSSYRARTGSQYESMKVKELNMTTKEPSFGLQGKFWNAILMSVSCILSTDYVCMYTSVFYLLIMYECIL